MELNLEEPSTVILLAVLALGGLAIILRVLGMALKAILAVVVVAGIAGGVYLYSTDALPTT